MKQPLIKIFALIGFMSQWALAADYQSPRSIGLGGSGHAGPLLNDAVFLNPSFTSFLPTYSVGLNYLSFNGEAAPVAIGSEKGKNYSVTVQDGRSDVFQAGAAYTQRVDATMVHVGVSKAIKQRVSFGAGGKFFFSDPTHSAARDAVVSATVIPSTWLQVAAVGDNMLENSAGQERGLYREYILGLKLNMKEIVLTYFDPHYTPSLSSGQQYGYEAGLEFVLMSDLFLRLGMFRNSNVPFQGGRGRGYGFGLGWVAPRMSLDYGLSRALEPVAAVAHTFGATLYF